MDKTRELRNRMVEKQIMARGIEDPFVIDALREVPRHRFVPKDLRSRAYEDCPLPIGEDQTISQPYMVALMTQALRLDKDDVVMEVGTGSGYQAAVLSRLCRKVYTIERLPRIARQAKKNLEQLGYSNIEVITGDGTAGVPNVRKPFDAIIVTAAAPGLIDPLSRQLANGGRMVMPVGEQHVQSLMLYTKKDDHLNQQEICQCVFVPLIGRHGWQER